ncbi:unnamed protein product [Arctia plantaginis]|uniref:Uncharacterized protein n=1 Tax=Arctia plantaginis TaxID=874455 RepID=A0A8S1BRI2_ARCPL|nr:unnamed protein product [Arctia plantaginis]
MMVQAVTVVLHTQRTVFPQMNMIWCISRQFHMLYSQYNTLLQNLLKDETKTVSNDSEPVDAGDDQSKDSLSTPTQVAEGAHDSSICNNPVIAANTNSSSCKDGDDDPPEEQTTWPKKTIMVAEAANVPLPDDDDEKETEDYEDKPGICLMSALLKSFI